MAMYTFLYVCLYKIINMIGVELHLPEISCTSFSTFLNWGFDLRLSQRGNLSFFFSSYFK